MKILVTGFKPFLNNKVNTSMELLKLIKEETLLLDVSYLNAPKELKEKINEYNPDFILSLGLNASLKEGIQIEKVAYNLMDSKGKDNDGIIKTNEIINKNKNNFYLNPIDFKKLENYLKSNDIKYKLSRDPGRYICNLVYFEVLSSFNKGLFIHVPTIKNSDELETIHHYIEKIIIFIKKELI